jgi:hypothetical protein
MITNSISRIAAGFVAACSEIPFTDYPEIVDLAPVLSTLPHLSLDAGYVLEGVTPGCSGMGGETMVFIRRKNVVLPPADELIHFLGHGRNSMEGVTVFVPDGIDDDDKCLMPLDHFSMKESPEGYWEVFLLSEMWRFLPLFWHAGYSRRTFILDADELLKIAPVPEEAVARCRRGELLSDNPFQERAYGFRHDYDIQKIVSLSGDANVLPRMTGNGSGFDISYHFWTEWGGLVREEVSVSRTGQGRIRIGHVKADNIASYECGIFF